MRCLLAWEVKTGGSIFVAAVGVAFLKKQKQGSKSWVALSFEAEAEVSRASSVVDEILISGGRILKRRKGVESPPQAKNWIFKASPGLAGRRDPRKRTPRAEIYLWVGFQHLVAPGRLSPGFLSFAVAWLRQKCYPRF